MKPILEVAISAERARTAFQLQKGGGFTAEVERATGARMFLRRAQDGALTVQFYGNEYACATAAKMVEEIREKNVHFPIFNVNLFVFLVSGDS